MFLYDRNQATPLAQGMALILGSLLMRVLPFSCVRTRIGAARAALTTAYTSHALHASRSRLSRGALGSYYVFA